MLAKLKAEGFRQGQELVHYNIQNLEITEETVLTTYKDSAIMFALEAVENYRQFSPFELFAKELNDSEDPDSAWEAYEDGISEGIIHAVDNIITDEYFETIKKELA